MGQLFSSVPWMDASNNEIGLTLNRTYTTKHPRITTLRMHPAGDLFVAGNEEGTLLLFDLSTEADDPRHCCTISYEYGGVSEICWLGTDFVAVGTTRGKIIIFAIGNDNRHLVEVMNVKAHGDGAAQIAVDGLDYCQTSHRLVSVAEGVGSVRLWSVADTGALVAQELPITTTAYGTPRYVSFLRGGTQILVAFMEKSMVQIFSVDPFELKLERFIGQEEGHHHGHLGSALVLDAMERLLVLNWRFGFFMFDFQPLAAHNPSSTPLIHCNGNNVRCNQGLAAMKGGTYVASVDGGVLRLWKAREGKSVGFLKTTGRDHIISAIHAVRNALVAASIHEGDGPTTIMVWRDEDRRLSKQKKVSEHQDRSTIKMALLCILVCAMYQFATSHALWTSVLPYLKPSMQSASSFSKDPYPANTIITITVTPSAPTAVTAAPPTATTPTSVPSSPSASNATPQEIPDLHIPSLSPQAADTVQSSPIFPLLHAVNNPRI